MTSSDSLSSLDSAGVQAQSSKKSGEKHTPMDECEKQTAIAVNPSNPILNDPRHWTLVDSYRSRFMKK